MQCLGLLRWKMLWSTQPYECNMQFLLELSYRRSLGEGAAALRSCQYSLSAESFFLWQWISDYWMHACFVLPSEQLLTYLRFFLMKSMTGKINYLFIHAIFKAGYSWMTSGVYRRLKQVIKVNESNSKNDHKRKTTIIYLTYICLFRIANKIIIFKGILEDHIQLIWRWGVVFWVRWTILQQMELMDTYQEMHLQPADYQVIEI